MADLKFDGISVATVGPALGHEMFVDDVTLLQAEQAGVAGSPVKVFVDHDESIDSLIGFLSNFRIGGDQLRADLELLSAHPQAEFYAEILTKAPGRVGFSMSFSGKPEEVGDQRFARVENLVSVDLVSRPAANRDGVFRAGSEPAQVDIAAEGMANAEPNSTEVQFDAKAAFEALAASVAKLEESIAAIAADKSEPAEAPAVEAEEVKAEEAAPAVESAELSALSAKVAELEIALAAKGSEAVSSNGAASEDPVEQFKAASEAKDWKRVAQLFSANKAAILRARNAKNF
jgi:hypothetical protein